MVVSLVGWLLWLCVLYIAVAGLVMSLRFLITGRSPPQWARTEQRVRAGLAISGVVLCPVLGSFLVLTALTSLSKFHLLWILALLALVERQVGNSLLEADSPPDESIRESTHRDSTQGVSPPGNRRWEMDEARWAGIAAIFMGALICAWQMYEVDAGDGFTVWIVWMIPLPVIVLGILFVLAGIVMLATGKS